MKEKWVIKKLPVTGGIAIYAGDDLIAGGLSEEETNLIVTAVNACKKINPDNPQAASDSIGDVYEALKEASELLKILPSIVAVFNKPEVKDHIPLGLTDNLWEFIKSNKTERALAKAVSK